MKIQERHSDGSEIHIQGMPGIVIRLLREWRKAKEPLEPDKDGAESDHERGPRRRYEQESGYYGGQDVPIVEASDGHIIGFRRNEQES